MADTTPVSENEPVDAEFEPVETERAQGRSPLALIAVFILASLAGGALGVVGSQYWPGSDSPAGASAEDMAGLSEQANALEARLSTIENRDPAGEFSDQLDRRLAAFGQRLDDLEAQPAPTGAAGVDADILAQLEARLVALETAPQISAPADTPADTAIPVDLDPLNDRLAALDEEAAQLRDGLRALEVELAERDARPEPEAVDLSPLDARLAALERGADERAAREGEITELAARIARLESGLVGVETLAQAAAETAATPQSDPSAEADRQLASRALALTALRDQAMTADPFEAERAALARLWRDNEDLDALAGYARAGTPTLDDLTEAYPGTQIRDAVGTGRVFFGLIEVREVSPGDSETGPLALATLSEDRLAQNDLAGAVGLTERLEGDALTAAQDWLLAARARLDTDARLAALRQSLAEDAIAQGADPS